MKMLRWFQFFSIIMLGLFTSAAKANLIVNGGFESPVVGPGGVDSGYKEFIVGQTIGSGWTVVGIGNDVTVGPGTETQAGGGTFTVEEGSQALDLTGDFDNDSPIGVQQDVATSAGTQYALSFYVGHFDSSRGGGSDATVILDLDGNPVLTAINSGNSSSVDNWQLFTYDFTASGPTTTLAFINGTSAGALYGGLDGVQLDAVPLVATPEPPALMLAGGGSILMTVLIRQKLGLVPD